MLAFIVILFKSRLCMASGVVLKYAHIAEYKNNLKNIFVKSKSSRTASEGCGHDQGYGVFRNCSPGNNYSQILNYPKNCGSINYLM